MSDRLERFKQEAEEKSQELQKRCDTPFAQDTRDFINWMIENHPQATEPEPPALQSGDRVAVAGIDVCATVTHINFVRIRRDDDSIGYRDPIDLTVIPPEPKYHVDYADDCLNLVETTMVDGVAHMFVACAMPMSDPDAVEAKIVKWGSYYGIDADAAREMIAEPRVIADMRPDMNITCVAIRTATGWYARMMGGDGCCSVDSTAQYGTPQTEVIGRGFFLDIKGPYVERTP